MIIPIIQTDSVDDLQAKLNTYAAVDLPGKPTHFQIDVNDGLFTHHFSVQPSDLRQVNWHGFTHEYHLLVDNPDEYLGDVSESGAVAVIAQIEHMHDRQNFIETAKQLNLKVGLALDFYTPASELSDQELNMIDILLLMSYKAGHTGPSLNQGIIPKIKDVKQRPFAKLLEIDGGINIDNLPSLKTAGATAFAVNSAVWHDGTVKQNLNDLLTAYAQNT